ncbi:hypothetical protein Tco_0928138 [Tanacetum coccineum]
MWTESVLTATYLINMLPTAVLAGKSPYELVYNAEPGLFHLKTFGCLCFLTVLNESDKFASKSDKCVFVGYAFDKKRENGMNDLNFFDEINESNLKSGEPTDDGGDSAEVDSVNITGSTSSRKVINENEYATEIKGIQGTELNDDEYESEGEDIESFGHLFGWSPEPVVGQTVRRSSNKSNLPTKYKD